MVIAFGNTCVPFVFHPPYGDIVLQFAEGGGPSAVLLKLSNIPVVGKLGTEGEALAEAEEDGL